jgi:hypothetical protein
MYNTSDTGNNTTVLNACRVGVALQQVTWKHNITDMDTPAMTLSSLYGIYWTIWPGSRKIMFP